MFSYCRHIRPSGGRCRTRAIEGHDFCYYHQSQRKPFPSLELPPIEDRFAVQIAVSRVLNALVSGAIDKRIAGLCLYGIQIDASNPPKDIAILDPERAESEIVQGVVLTQQQQEVAFAENILPAGPQTH